MTPVWVEGVHSWVVHAESAVAAAQIADLLVTQWEIGQQPTDREGGDTVVVGELLSLVVSIGAHCEDGIAPVARED